MTMRMPTDCTVRYSDVCVVLYRYCRATWAGGNSCGRSRNTGTGTGPRVWRECVTWGCCDTQTFLQLPQTFSLYFRGRKVCGDRLNFPTRRYMY